jgi:hypothetical protein
MRVVNVVILAGGQPPARSGPSSGRTRWWRLPNSRSHHEARVEVTVGPTGGFVVLFDTVIEVTGGHILISHGGQDNHATAVDAFLERNDRFEVDQKMDEKPAPPRGPGGYRWRR